MRKKIDGSQHPFPFSSTKQEIGDGEPAENRDRDGDGCVIERNDQTVKNPANGESTGVVTRDESFLEDARVVIDADELDRENVPFPEADPSAENERPDFEKDEKNERRNDVEKTGPAGRSLTLDIQSAGPRQQRSLLTSPRFYGPAEDLHVPANPVLDRFQTVRYARQS